MSNKAKRDAIKNAAKLHLSGEKPSGDHRVINEADRIAARNRRLSLARAMRRGERAERSIRRQAEARHAELTER